MIFKLSKYQHKEGQLKDKYQGKTRTKDRLNMIRRIDVKNKSVLDLGCNNGEMVMRAKEIGAKLAVGVDVTDCILGARELAKQRKLDVKFWQVDVESQEFKNFCPKFDVIICCSLLTHLKDPKGFLEWLNFHVGGMLFFESNTGEEHKKQIELVKKFIWFSRIKFLGLSEKKENGVHYMWRCYRSYEGIIYPDWKDIPVCFVPINFIYNWDNDFQLDKNKVKRLMTDIKKRGIRDPLIVKLSKKRGFLYKGIQGHHRFLAAKKLGYKDIPVKIII